MLAEAREKVKNPPPRPFPWFWVAIGVTLLSAGGYGAQFYIRWQHNRYRVQPVRGDPPAGGRQAADDPRRAESRSLRGPSAQDSRARCAWPRRSCETGISGLELDTTRPVVAYCTTPDEATSAKVAQKLRKMGFKDVRILKGGLGAWTNAGLPIESRSDLSQVGVELYKALAGETH